MSKQVAALLAALTLALPALGESAGEISDVVDIGPSKLRAMLESSSRLVVIDVRTSYEYDAGHIPGAVNITQSEIEGRLADLSAEAGSGIVLYCMLGARSRVGERLLLEWEVGPLFHLEGGFHAWKKAGYAVEKSPVADKKPSR